MEHLKKSGNPLEAEIDMPQAKRSKNPVFSMKARPGIIEILLFLLFLPFSLFFTGGFILSVGEDNLSLLVILLSSAMFWYLNYLGLLQIIPGLYTVSISSNEVKIRHLFKSTSIAIPAIRVIEHSEFVSQYKTTHFLKITYEDAEGNLILKTLKPYLLGFVNDKGKQLCILLKDLIEKNKLGA